MHTPIPWKIARFEGNVEASGRIVANTMSYSCNGPEGESARQENIANAAFIVTACNSHAALVEALEMTLEMFADGGDPNKVIDHIQEVLAKEESK